MRAWTYAITMMVLALLPLAAVGEEVAAPDPVLLQHGIEFTPAPDWHRYEVLATAVFFKSQDDSITLSIAFPQRKDAGAVAMAQMLLRATQHPLSEGTQQFFGVSCRTFVFEIHRGNQTAQLHDHQCLKDGQFYSFLFSAAPAEISHAQAMFGQAMTKITINSQRE